MRLVAHLDDLDLPVAGVLVGDRVLTLELLAEHAGLREELAFLDPRGLLVEDDDLAETRAALVRALTDGVAGVPVASLRRRHRSTPARSSVSGRTTPATSANRASHCPPGPCSSRSSPTRSWAIATP